MKRRHLVMGGAAAVGLGACSSSSKFKTYNGPEVTYVVVNKEARRMYLLHNDKVLKDYDIDLGFAPIGDKFFEGDGRTPEGNYIIDRRNPNSQFYLSLGISYPNARDRAEAAALGKPPGGDIFIHGNSSPLKRRREDWTWGCIAVTNTEMEDVYAMVRNGTPIQINA
ncbi:L,D-transpeptidase family protein [uncultured Tateyamaria sp.]|uniref:L,D-transpeptidase family protein n=1 Tax=uncultured Tateyamaria sp. TaxID=455651 RepID=UPI002615FB7C|nr:L,D-transpeptidase family protein [uncultured Tateyamaria sp.]